MAIEIVRVPDIGGFEGVDVVEILVAAGDTVAAEDPLITLESDKATLDVPSPAEGTVVTLLVEVGAKVSAGDPVLELEVAAPAAESAAEPVAASEPAAEVTAEPASEPASEPVATSEPVAEAAAEVDAEPRPAGLPPHASPSVRKLARELGVDLSQVSGTGRKGRITHQDVHDHVKARLQETSAAPAAGTGIPPMPEIDFAPFGPITEEPLSKVKRVGARNLHRAWLHVPHVTQHDEADITDLLAFRKPHAEAARRDGFSLTPLAFVMKAVVRVLKEMPRFNSSLSPDGQSLILKGYYHLGIAVDTPQGLVVPVLRDVDRRGVLDIARELAALGDRARNRKVRPGDLQGASFSVSNLGGIGGTAFTPIVNAPEVAILGVSRTRVAPRWNGETFEPRQILPLSLSYDHRVIDGAEAARFTTRLAALLGDLRNLVL